MGDKENGTIGDNGTMGKKENKATGDNGTMATIGRYHEVIMGWESLQTVYDTLELAMVGRLKRNL
ncbi:hypothetical protein TWF481_002943 [Arthrobotrys musiformis]|uniref:Uncharacterized protein n=1 Tax=Arthrobotrys musiformis TaxID=47236 RepID=A0AAV9VSV2_9PEZI